MTSVREKQKLAANSPAVARVAVIAPSVLSADFSRLALDVKAVMKAGCNWIHLDVMDNHFVPNLTFGAPVVASLRKAVPRAFFDAHLMVEEPGSLLEAFAQAGVQHLTFHYEACEDRAESMISDIKALGMTAGISIKPKTPLNTIEPFLKKVELVLVMTVEPGFGGQALIPSCVSKIRSLNKLRQRNGLGFTIQADGGVNLATANLVAAAGADVLVAGSAVFDNGAIASNISALNSAIQSQNYD